MGVVRDVNGPTEAGTIRGWGGAVLGGMVGEGSEGMEMVMGEVMGAKGEGGEMVVTHKVGGGMVVRRRRDAGASCSTRGRVRSVRAVPDGEVEEGSEG